MNEETNLKEFDKVLADIAKIKDKGNFLPDCSTKAGYEASKTFVLKVATPARSALSASHKKAKQYWLDGSRNVDSKKKELELMIKEVETPHREAYKYIDDEKKRIEKERVDNIQKGYDFLNGLVSSALNQHSTIITSLIEGCGNFEADPEVYDNQIDNICYLQAKVMVRLQEAHKAALRFEEMKRKEDEVLAQLEEMKKSVESNKINDIPENPDKEKRRKKNVEALESLCSHGVEIDTAKLVLKLIATNKIPHIQINY